MGDRLGLRGAVDILSEVSQIYYNQCISLLEFLFIICQMNSLVKCLRPYHVESTSSRPITEVKQHRVVLVLGWVTAWEYTML